MGSGHGKSKTLGVAVERDVRTEMRDGVVLRADVYRPEGPGRYPVLLQRNALLEGQRELRGAGAQVG